MEDLILQWIKSCIQLDAHQVKAAAVQVQQLQRHLFAICFALAQPDLQQHSFFYIALLAVAALLYTAIAAGQRGALTVALAPLPTSLSSTYSVALAGKASSDLQTGDPLLIIFNLDPSPQPPAKAGSYQTLRSAAAGESVKDLTRARAPLACRVKLAERSDIC